MRTFSPDHVTTNILEQVFNERVRQHEKLLQERAEGREFCNCTDPLTPGQLKVAVLGEEFGEYCKAMVENDDEGIFRELIHTAAVAVAIAESMVR